jgi:hypothetical protein
MKVLVEEKEIVSFLSSLILGRISQDEINSINEIQFDQPEFENWKLWALERVESGKIDKFRGKIKDKLQAAVKQDLTNYLNACVNTVKKLRNKKVLAIKKNLDQILDKLGKEKVLELYRTSNHWGYLKVVGSQINHNNILINTSKDIKVEEDCLFRNMSGNEELLLTKMDLRYPFWFIDTGYTNFLNGKKKIWHRLTRNHLHHINKFEAPVDRLNVFESFPMQWRDSGGKILIIEPGIFSANTFKIDISQWKKDIERELRQHTDKPIIFREKQPKKIRKNLYRELLDDDYYCVININSNAAIESLWAGVPVITLGQHISNSVTRNKISEINNLYRPHLANWLCMLSYSQFTGEEIANGTAIEIVRKYHV